MKFEQRRRSGSASPRFEFKTQKVHKKSKKSLHESLDNKETLFKKSLQKSEPVVKKDKNKDIKIKIKKHKSKDKLRNYAIKENTRDARRISIDTNELKAI